MIKRPMNSQINCWLKSYRSSTQKNRSSISTCLRKTKLLKVIFSNQSRKNNSRSRLTQGSLQRGRDHNLHSRRRSRALQTKQGVSSRMQSRKLRRNLINLINQARRVRISRLSNKRCKRIMKRIWSLTDRGSTKARALLISIL